MVNENGEQKICPAQPSGFLNGMNWSGDVVPLELAGKFSAPKRERETLYVTAVQYILMHHKLKLPDILAYRYPFIAVKSNHRA